MRLFLETLVANKDTLIGWAGISAVVIIFAVYVYAMLKTHDNLVKGADRYLLELKERP